MPKFQDMTGQTFGRWTVLSRADDYRPGIPRWLCRCSCGNSGIVTAGILKSGGSKSCGCFNRDVHRTMKTNLTHGKTRTPTHYTWVNMKQRCYNPSVKKFRRYGALGITVCDRWLNSFENFLEDMGERPEGLTIERVNNKGPYSPDNCIWASQETQQNNRGNNTRLHHNGKTMTLQQWARETGLRRETISHRIFRLRWTIADALTLPPSPVARNLRK